MAKTDLKLEVREVKNKFDWNDTINAAAASAVTGLTAPWLVAPFNAVDSSVNAKIFEHMPKGTPVGEYYKEMAKNPKVLKETYKAVPAKLAKNVPAQVATLGSFSLFKNMMDYANPKTDTKIQTRIKKEAAQQAPETKFKEDNKHIPTAQVIPKIEKLVLNKPPEADHRKLVWGGHREPMKKEAFTGAMKALWNGGKLLLPKMDDITKAVKSGKGLKGSLDDIGASTFGKEWGNIRSGAEDFMKNTDFKKAKGAVKDFAENPSLKSFESNTGKFFNSFDTKSFDKVKGGINKSVQGAQKAAKRTKRKTRAKDFGKGFVGWNSKGKGFKDFKKPAYLGGMGASIGAYSGFSSGSRPKTLFSKTINKQ